MDKNLLKKLLYKNLILKEAYIDKNGKLIDDKEEHSIFDSFPKDILDTLDNEYSNVYLDKFDWNKKSNEFGDKFNDWRKKKRESDFIKNKNKLLLALAQDLKTIKQTKLLEKKLKNFEDLIIPVFGEKISTDALSKYEESVLLDPNATLEDIEQGFKEAKNIIDKNGDIDYSKLQKSNLFNGNTVSIPKLERFVKENPEYKKTYDIFIKLNDEYTNLLLKDLNAFRSSTPFNKIKELYLFIKNL